MSEDIKNEDQLEEAAIVVLEDEDGKEHQFEFLDLIEYDSNEYVVLIPVEADEDEETEVFILKYELDEEKNVENYVNVEDEKVLETVYNMFKEKWNDEYNFVE